jgi:hypothetical protein
MMLAYGSSGCCGIMRSVCTMELNLLANSSSSSNTNGCCGINSTYIPLYIYSNIWFELSTTMHNYRHSARILLMAFIWSLFVLLTVLVWHHMSYTIANNGNNSSDTQNIAQFRCIVCVYVKYMVHMWWSALCTVLYRSVNSDSSVSFPLCMCESHSCEPLIVNPYLHSVYLCTMRLTMKKPTIKHIM